MFEAIRIPVLQSRFRPLGLLLSTAATLACCLPISAEAITFKLSSIGYHSQGAKYAVLEDIPEGQELKLVLFDATRRNPRMPVFLGATVYKFENPRVFQNKAQAGPPVKSLLLDFSDFQQQGTYEIRVEGTDIKSPEIRISDYLYWDNLKPVMRSFYFQRCGQEVEDTSLKLYHAACHINDADFAGRPDEDGKDVVGGWHNGGDYAKYATSTALAAAKLMAMVEWNAKPFQYFRMDYPLFEPGYGRTDDMHHEIMAGLDWLMIMQRRDGVVYRKVAGEQWPGNVTPDEDTQKRYIYEASTQDTAVTAAALAMGTRNFKKADLGYSVKTLLAAEKAWTWLAAHPQSIRPAGDFSGSGEFQDPSSKTDIAYRLWAAAELYVTTGKTTYHQYFLEHLKDVPLQRFCWQNPAILGMTDYLLYAQNQDPQAAAALKGGLLNMADAILRNVDTGLWPSGLSQYVRASNQEVAERAAILLTAYRLSGKDAYRTAASKSLAYLFGLNPYGITYISGLGGKSVQHPSHRWMEASGKIIPGFLVDGPNEAANDGKTPKRLGPMSYVDDAKATEVNESTLLNNAAMAYLLGVINDSYNVSQQEGAKPAPEGTPNLLDFKLAPERPSASPAKKAPVRK